MWPERTPDRGSLQSGAAPNLSDPGKRGVAAGTTASEPSNARALLAPGQQRRSAQRQERWRCWGTLEAIRGASEATSAAMRWASSGDTFTPSLRASALTISGSSSGASPRRDRRALWRRGATSGQHKVWPERGRKSSDQVRDRRRDFPVPLGRAPLARPMAGVERWPEAGPKAAAGGTSGHPAKPYRWPDGTLDLQGALSRPLSVVR